MSDAMKPGTPGRDPATDATIGGTRPAGEDTRGRTEEVRAQASAAAETVKREATGALSDVKAEGAGVVATAKDRAAGLVEEQKEAGARQAEGIADAVHRAADQLQDASPAIARYVHEAASSVDGLARTLRDRSPGEMMGRIEEFARRQPVAFFGASMLAGFALTRFARSSAAHVHHHDADRDQDAHRAMAAEPLAPHAERPTAPATPRTSATGAPGWVPDRGRQSDDTTPTSRPATTGAATLGGAAAQTATQKAQPATQTQTGPRGEIA